MAVCKEAEHPRRRRRNAQLRATRTSSGASLPCHPSTLACAMARAGVPGGRWQPLPPRERRYLPTRTYAPSDALRPTGVDRTHTGERTGRSAQPTIVLSGALAHGR